MSNKVTELLDKVKLKLAEMAGVPPVDVVSEDIPVEFKEYTLADGSVIKCDKFEVGGNVQVDDNGTWKPAPAGHFDMADGSDVTVDESGVITEIVAGAPDEVGSMPAQYAEQFDEIKADYAAKFAAQDESFKAELEAIKADNAAFKAQTTELLNTVGELINTHFAQSSSAPIDAPKAVVKSAFSDKKERDTERINNFLTALKSQKNK